MNQPKPEVGIPDIEVVATGGLEIIWLDKIHTISHDVINAGLVTEEQQRAEGMKAEARRTEFERTRYLLRKMTGWQQPFLPDTENIPVWPPGSCGSITHKSGHVGITVASSADYYSVGIDCEDASKDISHLKQKICTPNDETLIAALAAQGKLDAGSLTALIFSAKEALFKCHHPLGKTMFWFHDAEVDSIDLEAGTIALKVLMQTSGRTRAGHITNGHFVRKKASNGDYWLSACVLLNN
jgi:4'-phosphopantetheinyl transferase EntD